MADRLRLRWLDPSPNGEVAARDDSGDTAHHPSRHEVLNALTVVTVAAGLLHDRWDDLDDPQRRDLVATLRNRAEHLRALFAAAKG